MSQPPSVIFTVPLELPPLLDRFMGLVLGKGLIVLCLASVVFTTFLFFQMLQHAERNPHHGHTHSSSHRRSLDTQGSLAH